MGKSLVIAEKPSVALDIAKALGPYDRCDDGDFFETSKYVISFAVGHLVELNQPDSYDKKWKAWTLKSLPVMPETFERSPRDAKATKRLKVLKKLAKRADVDGYVNACDAGREGEHIFRTVIDWIGIDKPVSRLWLSSLTAGAIRKGFDSLRDGTAYDDLGDAASSRAEADWLIGMNATRACSIRLKSFGYEGVWTAGRVQTPTLTMLVDRELEIYAHRPVPYWQLRAEFEVGGQVYPGLYHCPKGKDRIFDADEAKTLLNRVETTDRWVASDKRSTRKRQAPQLFDLTYLQKTASNRFGFSAKRTLDAAQRLYERHKLISYPRTDSKFLPTDMKDRLDETVEALKRYEPTCAAALSIQALGPQNVARNFNDAKVTDHYAIVPIRMPDSALSGDDARIFELICSQFCAAFMGAAVWAKVKRTTVGEDVTFVTTGEVLETPGFELAFGKRAGYGSPLAALPEGDGSPAQRRSATLEEKETKPPARLSEAGLLTKMESCGKDIDDDDLSEAMTERGLGTPATRAETIEKLISRRYLAREGKSLRATAKAIRLIEVLRAAGVEMLTSVELTGEMEYRLRQVERGALSRDDYMLLMRSQTDEFTARLVAVDFDALYPKAQALGAVPTVGTMVRETPWGYEADGEPFFLWKDLRGHVIQPNEIAELLSTDSHRIGPVTLFPREGSRGDGYKALVQLSRHNDEAYAKLPMRGKRAPSRWFLEILDENGEKQTNSGAIAVTDEDVIGPLCTAKDGQEIKETSLRYADDRALAGERGGLTLPKEVCNRPITAAEARHYFEQGSTDFLNDFISKRGRPFKAKLLLKANGRHGFEFEPRKPRAKKAPAKAAAGKKKAASKPAS